MDIKKTFPLLRLIAWISVIISIFVVSVLHFLSQMSAPNLKIEKSLADLSVKFAKDNPKLSKEFFEKISDAETADYARFKMVRDACKRSDFQEAKKIFSEIKSPSRREIADAYISASMFLSGKKAGLELEKNSDASILMLNLIMYLNAEKTKSDSAPYYWYMLQKCAKSTPKSVLDWLCEDIVYEFVSAGLHEKNLAFWEAALPNKYDLSKMDTQWLFANFEKLPAYPKNQISQNNVYRFYRRIWQAEQKGGARAIVCREDAVKKSGMNGYRCAMVQLIEKTGKLHLKHGDTDGALALVDDVLVPMRKADYGYKITYNFRKIYPQCAYILALCGQDERAFKVVDLVQNPDTRLEVLAAIIRAFGERGDFSKALDLADKSNLLRTRFKIYFDIFK